MNIRSLRIQAVTVSVVMALVTGCGTASDPASSAAQPDPELTDITVAALPAADLAGLYIALDQGLFTKQGLRVTIEPIPSSQAIIPDQLKGQVDISAGSYIPYIAAQAAGARFRVLAEASTLRPDTRVLVTTANSPIVTVAGLTGRTIAVNQRAAVRPRNLARAGALRHRPARLPRDARVVAARHVGRGVPSRALYHFRGREIRRPGAG